MDQVDVRVASQLDNKELCRTRRLGRVQRTDDADWIKRFTQIEAEGLQLRECPGRRALKKLKRHERVRRL